MPCAWLSGMENRCLAAGAPLPQPSVTARCWWQPPLLRRGRLQPGVAPHCCGRELVSSLDGGLPGAPASGARRRLR